MRGSWVAVLAGAESLLVAGLLLLAAWRLWDSAPSGSLWPGAAAERLPPFASSELALAVVLSLGFYWLLQLLGRSWAAFRVAALLALLPHAPGIWAHNQLDWERFFGADTAPLVAGQSLFFTGSTFLLCLVGLVVLYRVVTLRQLGRRLSARRVEEADHTRIVVGEALALAGMIAVSLLLAFAVAVAGTALAGSSSFLGGLPWAVLAIGGGATVLLAGFLLLWFRGRGFAGGS